ncbi:glycine dehydrogenase (decarboxylating) subunit 2 gcvPB [Magnetospirillum sp. XM-1]|uniref:aminomethyl-transferring glycine dehydrogenase subunit GcvPB n=1 Tax=Magnetospirillum sp. XM-1 TaxID=1663591 RepID=UPI00073DDE33|nr:aminomethyl-transferring glycine dehydrogenase subunit GcvPB [Magnetospirillum sp. XM-1]CUW41534.1 glycine dehydrogenase (decarboxylating) subunit 2 gcvPB [Magnetospirillum sp. XM-1]
MSEVNTISGNRALLIEEKLIFEMDNPGSVAIDLAEPAPFDLERLGDAPRRGRVALPDLSEPQVVRHYTRLSQKNYGIDTGFYPLGSCTMKHNPRLSEKVARLAGLADLHPLQPQKTVQGALEVIDQLATWLKELTGMPAVAMSPAAGAHGEWCGLMAIRSAHEDKGEGHRKRVLVPESAHGTNPASAAMCGYTVDPIPALENGRVDLAALKAKLGPDVACLMLTNPNTCGLFETEIIEIASAVHGAGAYFYCDGANFNAIVGRVKIADLGIDTMHINLHKTFSTPHGGGGPGAGPTVLSAALAPFAPVPYVVHGAKGLELVEGKRDGAKPFGRVKGFHGQFGVFIRALAYIMSMGSDGLRQASSDAVLNANYLLASLKDDLSASFDGPCMHEALFDDRFLKDTGVTTLDFAKAMIDEGYHPMTMYFPLVVHGALLMEPTETESKEALDQYIGVVKGLAAKARAGAADEFKAAPRLTPRRRLDETLAARSPVLRWKPAAE